MQSDALKRTKQCWSDMKQRCLNPKNAGFKNYGGRGISVCERWRRSFDDFLSDMGIKPDGLSIERNDVNGNYELENCRWATNIEQQNNRRNCVHLTADGKTMTVEQWSQHLGMHPETIRHRIRAGHSDVLQTGSEKALNRDASGAPKPHKNNQSGYRGVCRLRDKWRAQMKVNNKKIHIGTFNTPEEAYAAYLKAMAKEAK